MSENKIHVFSIMRNDEYILPYFLRHYETFADRIFVIDDHSTDKTPEIARAHPKVTLLPFEYNRGMNEDDFNECFEKMYKKYSRGQADWVICADSDELIYNEDILTTLTKLKKDGHQVIHCEGYMMVSETLPSGHGQIYDEVKKGMRYKKYDKTVVFDPSIDISFGHGRHTTTCPRGIRAVFGGLKLLHFRYLSVEYFVSRSTHLYERANYDDATKKYRMGRGLGWYKRVLNSDKLIEII